MELVSYSKVAKVNETIIEIFRQIIFTLIPECDGPNTAYNNCEPGCNNPTCLKPRIIKTYCRGNCRSGCFCKRGYILDHTGQCILKENCPCKYKKSINQLIN